MELQPKTRLQHRDRQKRKHSLFSKSLNKWGDHYCPALKYNPMRHTIGTQYLLTGKIVGTFKGFKETPAGLLFLFQIPGQTAPATYSKFEIIKKV